MRQTGSPARAAARASLLVHVGPGMTNAATGVATAAFDSIPLVVIAGDVPSYYEGRGPHQEFNLRRDADQVSVYEPFVKRAWRVRRADQVPRVLARAWDMALAGGPGPVLVSVPMDILGEPLDAAVVPASPVARPALSRETAAAIAAELRRARRPVLLAGGARGAPSASVARSPSSPAFPSSTASWAPGSCRPATPSCSA